MLVSCKICHREYVASKKPHDGQFVCSRCQSRAKEQNHNDLGLHPALMRKWAQNNQQPSRTEIHGAGGHLVNGTLYAKDDKNKPSGLSDSSSLPKIPGFEIAYQIGRGAMGSVYRARQIKTGQMVAIKVLACDLSERADLVARFEREAYALKSLNNSNVVSIIDAGHVGDTHYFAMEFIDGMTLRTRINRDAISIKEAAFITTQILNGLKAAHQHGIIHRDLKPENVLLAYDGHDFSKLPKRVVLVDFGLVGLSGLLFDPHPNLTRSRVTMGTVNYMAPEQHIDAKRVDHRSDLYSAGVIFFEMLTKELPLGRYLMPYERGMDVPKEVDAILANALSRTADERYASASQFLMDLHELPLDEEQGDANAKSPSALDILFKLKANVFKSKYVLLILMAGIFFAFGVKISRADAKPEEKKTIEAKVHRPS